MTPQLGRPPSRAAAEGSTASSCPAIAGATSPIVERVAGAPVELGPEDLRDLPRFFGGRGDAARRLRPIRHRDPRRDQPRPAALSPATCSPPPSITDREGADVIDLGCDPGGPWPEVGRRSRPSAIAASASRSTASTPSRSPTPSPRARTSSSASTRPTANHARGLGRRGRRRSPTSRARSTASTRRSAFLRDAGRPVPDRPDPRADRLRLRRVAGPLPRGRDAVPRGPRHDGGRQPDRADRRRLGRRQHAARSASARSWGSGAC